MLAPHPSHLAGVVRHSCCCETLKPYTCSDTGVSTSRVHPFLTGGRGSWTTGLCGGSVHVVFVSDCSPTGDWQAEGLIHSWAQTGPQVPAIPCHPTLHPSPPHSPPHDATRCGFGFQQPVRAAAASPPCRPREDGLVHPAGPSRSNLAAALRLLSSWWRLSKLFQGAPHNQRCEPQIADVVRCDMRLARAWGSHAGRPWDGHAHAGGDVRRRLLHAATAMAPVRVHAPHRHPSRMHQPCARPGRLVGARRRRCAAAGGRHGGGARGAQPGDDPAAQVGSAGNRRRTLQPQVVSLTVSLTASPSHGVCLSHCVSHRLSLTVSLRHSGAGEDEKAAAWGAPTAAAAARTVNAVDDALVVLRAGDWSELALQWMRVLDELLRGGSRGGAEVESEAFRWAALARGVSLTASACLVLSDPTDSAASGQPWHAVGLAPGGTSQRGTQPPDFWIPPISRALRVPVVQYPHLYSIQVDGAFHTRGWSFDRRDYSAGGRWEAHGAGLLRCPPDHTRLMQPDGLMPQRLWRAWGEETATVDHGDAALLPPRKDAAARKLGGHGGTLGGGVEDRRRAWMMHVLDANLMAAAHHYRTRVCVAYDAREVDPPLAPVALLDPLRVVGERRSGGGNQTLVSTLVAAGKLPPSAATGEEGGKRTVAVVVTVAGDGPQGDGAAVLALSVLDAHKTSRFRVHLIAIVHPSAVRMCAQLQAVGFEVVVRPTPVLLSQIADTPAAKAFKQRVVTSGCCGLKELIKLEGLTLTRYHRVLLLDMDTLMTNPIDELYELDHDLIHTRNGKGTEALQGGFLLVRPSMVHYHGVLQVLRRGDFRYDGGAWEGSRIGHNYGGETIQGVVPFYFSKYAPPGSVKVVSAPPKNPLGPT
jgi:hypothetical protein